VVGLGMMMPEGGLMGGGVRSWRSEAVGRLLGMLLEAHGTARAQEPLGQRRDWLRACGVL
jgi:hypothetical protein